MKLGIGIITVRDRLSRAAALAQQLASDGYVSEISGGPLVNLDEERRGPWWNFKTTAELLLGQGHTHLCVLEDDVRLCSNFLGELRRVLEIVPSDPLSLFTARRSIVAEADKKQTKLLKRHALDTAQGLVFPSFQFERLRNWVVMREEQDPDLLDAKRWSFHGDVRINDWSKAKRWPIVHVIPNLVDHDVTIPSSLGHAGATRYGARVSPRFYDHSLESSESPWEVWGVPR
jgi:hypothetical protein